MVFSSLTFIFFFLPLVLLLYSGASPKGRLALLLIASCLFYFYGENYQLWVMVVMALANYLGALGISGAWRSAPGAPLARGGPRTTQQRLWLYVSVGASLSLLGYFKYLHFVVGNANAALAGAGLAHLQLKAVADVALPLGISFYTFQGISYVVDVYRGNVAATRSLLGFSTYLTMFPQLVAGPIVRYSDIERQLRCPQQSADQFADGARRFMEGLAKKVLIANPMGYVADQVFSLPDGQMSMAIAWLGVVAYTLQIYFDFSGYSCMAIGLGKMFGFDFPENFRHPYAATSVKDFWRRWHISLSTWFRDYVYIPLGGSRGSAMRTSVNLLVVFIACGLWHGASWNFVAWGLFHGAFLSLERTRVGSWIAGLPAVLRHGYLLLVVMVGWVFFRTETMQGALTYLGHLFIPGEPVVRSVADFLAAGNGVVLAAGILFATPLAPWARSRMASLGMAAQSAAELLWLAAVLGLFALSIATLAAGSFNPFIYFRF